MMCGSQKCNSNRKRNYLTHQTQLICYYFRTPSPTTLHPYNHTPHRENTTNLDALKFDAFILKTVFLVNFFL